MRHSTVRRIAAFASLAVLTFTVSPVLAAVITGTVDADHLVGTAEADEIRGYAGADDINGKEVGDFLDGGRGNDRILGGIGRGRDELYGRSGDDRLFPGGGQDYVSGGPGDDLIRAADYRVDTIVCGDDWDTVYYDLRDYGSYGTLEDVVADDCEELYPVGTPTPPASLVPR